MSSSSPDVPSAGSLIWTSLVPLLKIALVAVAGFTLTKKGLFPPAASRGFSQVSASAERRGVRGGEDACEDAARRADRAKRVPLDVAACRQVTMVSEYSFTNIYA